MNLKLFYVCHGTRTNDGNSDDRDLFICAENKEQAVAMWRGCWGDQGPEVVWQLPVAVFGRPRVLNWNNQVVKV